MNWSGQIRNKALEITTTKESSYNNSNTLTSILFNNGFENWFCHYSEQRFIGNNDDSIYTKFIIEADNHRERKIFYTGRMNCISDVVTDEHMKAMSELMKMIKCQNIASKTDKEIKTCAAIHRLGEMICESKNCKLFDREVKSGKKGR